MNARRANLDKTQRRIESIRCGIWRVHVDFADDAIVPGTDGVFEEIVVKAARATATARRGRHDDAVDIDKARIARAEPEEIRVVISGVLIEREQEGVDISNSSRQEGLAYQIFQPRRLQPRQCLRMGVVERE